MSTLMTPLATTLATTLNEVYKLQNLTDNFISLIVLSHHAKQGRQLSLFWCLFACFILQMQLKLQQSSFYIGDNFSDFLLASLYTNPLVKKRSTLKGKNLLQHGANSFHLDHISERSQKNSERVNFHIHSP